MHVQHTLDRLPPETAVCIGAFDGLHRGHQALFDRATELAPRRAIMTFEPHPLAVLAPDRAPPRLQTEAQREWIAADLGLDHLAALPFTRDVSSMSPEEFVRVYLVDGLCPSAVVVGDDFRFGARRAGGPADLQALLAAQGIVSAIVPQVTDASGEKLGSTSVRNALRGGDVTRAAQVLGRWHAVEGTVVHGAARGRELGVRTANVRSAGSMVPATGVYAVVLVILDEAHPLGRRALPSVANVGVNPTFATDDDQALEPGLEVHVLDEVLGDSLYERRVEVSFVARLRDEQTFPSAEALVAAIHDDVARARPLLDADALARVVLPPPGAR